MLNLFHELGTVIYFTATSALQRTVITDPQWLITKLSKVIRDERLHGFDENELERLGLLDELRNLFSNAIVSEDLLEYFWHDEHKEYLLDLMRRTMLLSDWDFEDQRNMKTRLFIIPSMLKQEPYSPGNLQTSTNQDTESTEKVCVLDFGDSFLPSGVFERLVCLCVAISSSQNDAAAPFLWSSSAKVWFSAENYIKLKLEDNERIVFFFCK
mmetsp:Transcript_33588/g.41269  ORF Transcript_33588/g.41269 Transcript_33588/m.41269 type:complete len:212 (+) Transcript_33588:71-706(+)